MAGPGPRRPGSLSGTEGGGAINAPLSVGPPPVEILPPGKGKQKEGGKPLSHPPPLSGP